MLLDRYVPKHVRRRRAPALSAFAVVVGGVFIVVAPGAPAWGSDTTWAIQPSTGTDGQTRVSLRYEIDAGSDVSDSVVVTNFSDHTSRFAVYASDGTITEDGSFDLISDEQSSRDGGAWIEIGPAADSQVRPEGGLFLTVPAKSAVAVPVQIDVPVDATPGDHPAGIVAELAEVQGEDVEFATRVGVRVHLRVLGDIVAELTPQIDAVSWAAGFNPFAPGRVRIDYRLLNNGNVRLGATGEVQVAGPLGIGVADAEIATREILPGETYAQSVELHILPLLLGFGLVEVNASAVGTDSLPGDPSPVSVDFIVWSVPWPQMALALVTGATVLGALRLIRRQRRRFELRVEAAVVEAQRRTAEEPLRDEATPRVAVPTESAK
ncbi:hypothetical protein [Microbacterium invictum]|uniref:DUF916 domain-containing protein n=1 Tax=Microbacterium invictum TaxID=515415 RepID=A0AA40SRC2_9MICO|nr:hypothetical protein [Microbacterium invictum]MBB4140820.1 hypothetical protein [Microbacterium invictum]